MGVIKYMDNKNLLKKFSKNMYIPTSKQTKIQKVDPSIIPPVKPKETKKK